MSIRDDILSAAPTFAGMPYRMVPPPDGVTSIDCSLFVLKVFEAVGRPLQGVRTAEQIRQATVPIDFDDVQPGDLLFFEHTYEPDEAPGPDGKIASHVGISLGRGTHRMKDAHERQSSPDAVGVTVLSQDYWQPKLFEARRHPALVGATDVANPPVDPPPTDLPRGIDVAVYQGNPAWPAVARSGVAFAFTKATQGVGYVNPTFAYNWAGIPAAGLVAGAYHFPEPDENAPEDEVAHFLATVEAQGGARAGDLLALDLEDFEGSLARANDVGGWALAWLRRVEQLVGFKPLLYTNPSTIVEHSLFGYPALAEYGLWLANYRETMPSAPAPWERIAFWQHSSSGSVPGISGDVDLDVFNGSADRIRLYGNLGDVQPSPAPSVPAQPAPSPADDPDAWIRAVAYLADDVAAIEDRNQRLAEARRVREEYVGPRTAA